ncbi:MAG TPA: aminotransferase class I/II-fold pyridoxal phosphate-dependent enzyme [Thermomicrobiales bacterium]|nr:aminotransferase class I/II-fold pyridoxal phosphate-dependent enzyme [Thermomicrobiales bacterium]
MRDLLENGIGAKRIRSFRETVFAEMSALSQQYGAVNLGQGFPDFPGPSFVKEAAKRAIDGDHNQYAHPHGAFPLREAIATEWGERFGRVVDPVNQVTVTSGATEAVFDIILALIDPGDELVVFEPYYDSYPASVTMAGGVMKLVRLEPPDWSFDPDTLRAAITENTKVILLNTPHNPTGKVFSRPELEFIANLAIDHDLLVVTDEVYDRIVFDGVAHLPIATLPGMWERTLTINSVGKTFSLTGWKVGYAIGPEPLIDALRSVHQWVTFATSTPFQIAMAEAIPAASATGYYESLRAEYHERREVLANVLVTAGLPPLHTAGSFFLMTGFGDHSFATDVDFCRWLIVEKGVTPIPPSAFYGEPATAPQLLRFCFAKQLATLREAGRRLGCLAPAGKPA